MSKRLILVLALAVMVGFAFAAYAEVQNVKVSGDLTVYGISRMPYFGIVTASADKRESAMASIARVRVDADLTDNVIATVRLLNERYWGNETDNVGIAGEVNSNIDLDLAYVTMKEFLYSPLTLMVGRQELHFGNDMIVGDPDTNNAVSTASPLDGLAGAWPRDPDLSARKAFDAIRATLDYDPLIIDLVFAEVDKVALNTKSAEQLYGINAMYAINKKNDVEAYWFERLRGRETTANQNKNDRVDNLGIRGVSRVIDNVTLQAEAAMQLGTQVVSAAVDRHRRAWALETSATLDMRNMKRVGKYNPTMSLLYNYFSGAKGKSSNKTTTAWDAMYENQTAGNLSNTLFAQSNVHVLGAIATAVPVQDVALKLEYYAYWWDKRFVDGGAGATVLASETLTMSDKKFVGQEVDLTAMYNYTEDVQFALMGGWFVPGTSFKKDNRGVLNEVIGSMKVTF